MLAVTAGDGEVKSALMVAATPADGGGLACHHRLVEMNAVGTAVPLVMTRVDVALAHHHPTLLDGGELGGLTAIRRTGPGGCRRADQE
jgi:hypothetical protein